MMMNHTIPNLPSFVAIFAVIAGYYLYYFIAYSSLPDKFCARFSNDRKKEICRFLMRKVIGFVFLGLGPAVVMYANSGIHYWGFRTGSSVLLPGLGLFTGLAALVISLSAFSSRKKSVLRKLPQIRTARWNGKTVLIAVAGWAIYLFAYEFLFRGIFLFSWIEYYGFWPAIAVNVAVYSAFHLPNGMDETLGALILGFLLCWISFFTQTFIFAFLLHLALAVSGEMFAVHYNPEMAFSFDRSPGKNNRKMKEYTKP